MSSALVEDYSAAIEKILPKREKSINSLSNKGVLHATQVATGNDLVFSSKVYRFLLTSADFDDH